ncbi:protein of unknown function [Caballeronia sp. S22]
MCRPCPRKRSTCTSASTKGCSRKSSARCRRYSDIEVDLWTGARHISKRLLTPRLVVTKFDFVKGKGNHLATVHCTTVLVDVVKTTMRRIEASGECYVAVR